jgi:hypothetical protein
MVQTLFGGAGYLSILFTEHAREWFSESLGEYLEFDEFPTT